MSDTPRTDAVAEYCGGNCMGRDFVEADFARELERSLNEEQRARRIAEVKSNNSLANNLCPDHRDKQVGKPCLACTIEKSDAYAGRYKAALEAERDWHAERSREAEAADMRPLALLHEGRAFAINEVLDAVPGYELPGVAGQLTCSVPNPLTEPIVCKPMPAVDEDGWCEWTHPVEPYYMQCCDCDLIHEMQFRIVKEKHYNEDGSWHVVQFTSDPTLEVIFRARRHPNPSLAGSVPTEASKEASGPAGSGPLCPHGCRDATRCSVCVSTAAPASSLNAIGTESDEAGAKHAKVLAAEARKYAMTTPDPLAARALHTLAKEIDRMALVQEAWVESRRMG